MEGTPDRSANHLFTVGDYFNERGVPLETARKLYSPFGRALKRKHVQVYGFAPLVGRRYINGHRVTIYMYRQDDRYLFAEVWNEMRMEQRISVHRS